MTEMAKEIERLKSYSSQHESTILETIKSRDFWKAECEKLARSASAAIRVAIDGWSNYSDLKVVRMPQKEFQELNKTGKALRDLNEVLGAHEQAKKGRE